MYQQAIDTGRPQWAAAAMISLARLLRREGDLGAVEAMYQSGRVRRRPDCVGLASLAQ